MTRQFIRASPPARRRAVLIVAAGALLGVLAIQFASATLSQVNSVPLMRRWLWAAGALASGGALAAGSYLAWLGRKVQQAGQFPLPNQVVIRDTRVRQGRAAVQLAWLAWACAVAFWLAGLAIPLLVGGLIRSLDSYVGEDRSPPPRAVRRTRPRSQ